MTYAKKTLSEIKLIHGDYGNFIKGQKLQKDKEKKYKKPPYQDLAASTEIEGETLDEKCWPGYEKKGMKTMFGKRYPNCVKKKKTRKEEFSDWRSELDQVDEGIGSALKAFSKLPAKQRLPLGFAGLFAAGATTRAIQKVKKYMDDKNIDKQVDKYVAARQIPGGPKKIDASPYNAPHHVDYMKSEKPKYEPIQYYDEFGNPRKKTRDELGLRGVNAEKRVPREKYKIKTRSEATMTPAQKRKDTLLKKKYEKSDDMMKSFKDQYGKEKGKNVFYAFIRKKSMEEENIQEILDKKDVPHVKKLVGKLRSGSKTHAKQADDLEKAMKENTAIESELVIQDWNVDDIKFTEIETVDIIKAKPLKENIDLDEGIKKEIAKKLAKKLAKQFKKAKNVKGPFDVTGKEAMKMKRTGSSKLDFPIDKATSQNIQTKSIINQAKKANELGMKKLSNKKSLSGKDLSKPIKVNLQKKIDFDKYLGGTPNKIQKKFGTTTPTGTFTDDLPPVKTVPLNKSQLDLMKKTTPKKIKKKVKKITMKDKMKEIENDPMSKMIKKEIEKETGTKTRKFSQKGGVTKGNENEILSNVKPKPKKPLKEGMAGAMTKGGSKLIPALMTGIGAAGTIMQSQKEDDKDAENIFSEVEKMMKKKNPSTGNRSRAERRIAELKDKLRRNADKRRMEKSYKKPASDKNEHYDWKIEIDEDWQKVNRKDKTDGLSKAAVKAYRRENPGSKLQTAVTKDPKKLKKGSKSAKRRLSFCRRMKGMKKKLTSAKTRRDPDSRINKALRRWNC